MQSRFRRTETTSIAPPQRGQPNKNVPLAAVAAPSGGEFMLLPVGLAVRRGVDQPAESWAGACVIRFYSSIPSFCYYRSAEYTLAVGSGVHRASSLGPLAGGFTPLPNGRGQVLAIAANLLVVPAKHGRILVPEQMRHGDRI